MPDHKYCTQCRSQNIYVSPKGYDTVIVCRDCHHEEHAPYADKINSDNEVMKEWKDITTDTGGEG